VNSTKLHWMRIFARGKGIKEREAIAAKEMANELNKLLSRSVRRAGIPYVDVRTAFAGHGYCTSSSYFVFAEDSCKRQGAFEGVMHPNKNGTAKYVELILAELRRRVKRNDLGRPDPLTVTGLPGGVAVR
jgi:hypothetical protein